MHPSHLLFTDDFVLMLRDWEIGEGVPRREITGVHVARLIRGHDDGRERAEKVRCEGVVDGRRVDGLVNMRQIGRVACTRFMKEKGDPSTAIWKVAVELERWLFNGTWNPEVVVADNKSRIDD